MTRPGPWIVFSFWVLLAQIFVLSQIEVGGYLSPYLYPLIVILAPANFNRLGLLAIGAVLGLGIDLHEGSGGLHLMASSLLAYIRPWVLKTIVPRASEEQLSFAPKDIGLGKWTTLILITMGIHHLWIFAWASHGTHIVGLVFGRGILNIAVSASIATAVAWFIPKSQVG